MTPAAVLSILVKANGVAAATGELGKLEGAAKKTSKSTDAMAQKSKQGFDTIGKASKYVALGVAGIGGAAVKMAGDFQSSMNQLQAVSGVSTRQLNALRKEAIKLGADTKLPATSAKDAAEAMKEMVKAGVSVKDTMGGVRDVLVLSAAAQIDNARAAEIASNAMNAFHLKGKDVKQITDELANTANASSVEITDVADSFNMAAAVFSGFQGPAIGAKKAMTELNVAIGLLGNAGIKGSDAGTSLKQMLLQLTGPAQKTKNLMRDLFLRTDGSAEAQRLFTVSIEGTTKAIREKASVALEKLQGSTKGAGDIAYDAAGKMRSLPQIIDQVTRATKGMTQEQKNQVITQIFGADATRSVIALMNAGPAAFDKMTASVTKQGAAQELANSKMKGFKGSVEAFKSTLETLAITFGTVLLPAVTSIVKQFTGFANILGAHRKATMITIGVLGTFAAAVYTVNTAVKVLKATTAAMTAVQVALDVAMDANPIVLAIAAIVGLGVAIVIAYKKIKPFRDAVNATWGAIKSGVSSAIDFVKQHWLLLLGILTGPFGLAVVFIVKHFGQIKDEARKLPGQIANAIKNLPGTLLDAGKWMVRQIIDGIKSIPGEIVKVGGWLKDKVVNTIKGIFGIASPSTVFEGLGRNMIEGLIRGLKPSNIRQMVTDAIGKVPDLAANAVSGPLALGRKVAGALTGNHVGASGSNQQLGRQMMLESGWPASEWSALRALWTGESGWRTDARNSSSGAYGIPQSLPASKMASAGADYLTNPATQIRWGLGYIRSRYGSPSNALAQWQARSPHWYAKGTKHAAKGLAVVGEKGPELVKFRGGEQVFAHGQAVAGARHAAAVRGARGAGASPYNPLGLSGLAYLIWRRNLAKGFTEGQRPAVVDQGSGEDPNQPLIDALEADAEAQKALADQLAGVRDELAKQTAFATSVQATDNFQLKKGLADLLSGYIVGYGVVGRAFTPGTGVEVAY